jgi:hypothetical protein
MSDEDNGVQMTETREERRKKRRERKRKKAKGDADEKEGLLDNADDETEEKGGDDDEDVDDAGGDIEKQRKKKKRKNRGDEKGGGGNDRARIRHSKIEVKFKVMKMVMGFFTVSIIFIAALGFEVTCMFQRLCNNYEDPAVPNSANYSVTVPTNSFIPLMIVTIAVGILCYSASASESSLKLFVYAFVAIAFATIMLVFGVIVSDLGNDTKVDPAFPKTEGGSDYYTSAEGIAQSKWNTLPEAMVSEYYPAASDLKKKFIANTELMAGFEISLSIVIFLSAIVSVGYALKVRGEESDNL